MFLKYLKLVLINSLFISTYVFANDVEPEGELISGFPEVSENPTVRMYLNPKFPPVVNITPGRPTIMQFPNEIAHCDSANKLITFVYSDKKTDSNANTSNLNDTVESYSSVTVTANPEEISKLSSSQLLKLDGLTVTCKVRISNPDTLTNASYAWRIVAIKIVGPKHTHLVVHLLDRPIIKNTRAEQILSDKQVEQLPYIDINKLSKNTINKAKGLEKKQDSNFVLNEPKNDKKENNKNYTQYENDKSLLDLYDFKDVKKL